MLEESLIFLTSAILKDGPILTRRQCQSATGHNISFSLGIHILGNLISLLYSASLPLNPCNDREKFAFSTLTCKACKK